MDAAMKHIIMRSKLPHRTMAKAATSIFFHRSCLVNSTPMKIFLGSGESMCALRPQCRWIHYHSHSNAMYNWSQQKGPVPHVRPTVNLLSRQLTLPQEFRSRCLQTEPKQNASNKGAEKISLWKRAVIVATVGGLVWYSFRSVNTQKGIDEEKVRYDEFKKAEIGGDWLLTDQNGKRKSSTELRGQWILMYFGFSHCPDICPEELEKLIKIVKKFDDDPALPSMLPIFITLDPDRDTSPVIKDYLADLKYPRMLGFTGTEEEITKVAKQFRAYFKKGPPDEDNDYIVDHTIVIYLINPRGEFVNYYDRSRTAEVIFRSVSEHVNKYTGLEKLSK